MSEPALTSMISPEVYEAREHKLWAEIYRMQGKINRQRRELRRLNKTLESYWKGRLDGFRHGIELSVRQAVATALRVPERDQ